LCLISGNRTDVVSRSMVISTVLLMVEPSRLGVLFKGNWEFDMKNFREVAYEHWALPAGRDNTRLERER
jgi:hypothetical protein